MRGYKARRTAQSQSAMAARGPPWHGMPALEQRFGALQQRVQGTPGQAPTPTTCLHKKTVLSCAVSLASFAKDVPPNPALGCLMPSAAAGQEAQKCSGSECHSVSAWQAGRPGSRSPESQFD